MEVAIMTGEVLIQIGNSSLQSTKKHPLGSDKWKTIWPSCSRYRMIVLSQKPATPRVGLSSPKIRPCIYRPLSPLQGVRVTVTLATLFISRVSGRVEPPVINGGSYSAGSR